MTITLESLAARYKRKIIKKYGKKLGLNPKEAKIVFRDMGKGGREGFLAGYQAAAQWISVKDRLPEDGIEALFFSPKKEMNCCFVGYKAKENEYVDPEGNGLIPRQIEKYYTHWMPLPKPPEEV